MPRKFRIPLIIFIVTVLTVSQRHFALDDALIYDRYIRNALNGHGLVFNVGEHVNALTSPLYAVLLLVASWVTGGKIIFAGTLLSATFLSAAACIAESLVAFSGLLIVVTQFFYFCFGMETSLFLMMLALCIWLYREEHFFWIPLACLLTCLTRFEGAFIAFPIAYLLAKRHKLPSVRAYWAPIAITAGYLAFNFANYGHLLPDSSAAKFLHGRSGLYGRWPTAFLHSKRFLLKLGGILSYLLPVAIPMGFLGYRKLRATPINKTVPAFLISLLGFYILGNIFNYHWYDAPFLFFGLLYVAAGIPGIRSAYACLAVFVTASFAYSAWTLTKQAPVAEYVAVAKWITAHSETDAKVAAGEIGTLGWYCDRNVDDIVGLTNPPNARSLARGDLTSWLERDKPDFVVTHAFAGFGEVAAVTSPAYVPEPVQFGSLRIMRRKPLNPSSAR